MTKSQLQDKARALFDFFDSRDDGYYPDHHTAKMFEVNVKRYHDNFDVESLIIRYPKKYQKELFEEFTPDRVNDLYWHWLEYESDQLYDNLKSGGHNIAMTVEKWHEYCLDSSGKIKKETGWPAIDDLKTESAKRAQLQKFIDDDKKILDAFALINTKTMGQYGRMAGHYCFDVEYNYDYLNDVIDWNEPSYDESMTIERAGEIIKEAEEIQDYVIFIKKYIDDYNKGLDPEAEIKFRIDEKLEEIKENEKDIRTRKATPSFMNKTLAELLEIKDETIRRNAISILKQLQK